MSYLERQSKCGIQIGDEVEVLRTARGYEDGWCNSWCGGPGGMDDCVGNVYKVGNIIGNSGICLNGTNYAFPYFVLGPEKEESDDPVTE